jgi:hypothetical protein
MSRLEHVGGGEWRDFVGAPASVLVIGKRSCPACQAFTEELEAWLAEDDPAARGVRFGKLLLDEPGLADFKRANAWLAAEIDTLPFVQLYRAGARWKDFAGGGIERLRRRLESLPETDRTPR